MARWFIIVGIVLVAIGVLLYFVPGLFNWFGKLPGDIRIEKENSRVYFPITTMIVISVILTIVINVIRFLGK
jgi:hypothetical protein